MEKISGLIKAIKMRIEDDFKGPKRNILISNIECYEFVMNMKNLKKETYIKETGHLEGYIKSAYILTDDISIESYDVIKVILDNLVTAVLKEYASE